MKNQKRITNVLKADTKLAVDQSAFSQRLRAGTNGFLISTKHTPFDCGALEEPVNNTILTLLSLAHFHNFEHHLSILDKSVSVLSFSRQGIWINVNLDSLIALHALRMIRFLFGKASI